MEESSWRRHHRGVIMEESWLWNHCGGIIAVETQLWHPGYEILCCLGDLAGWLGWEEDSRAREHKS